ncbi:hypothetical protein DW228_08480 [Bacteroides fragilis]|uniref:Uncharacterized protein n=1 Tax=Bacteroides fragilis TaxID=817 RepID=A0A396C333_BACFG|nr:hypothetical protein DW228_08480 [Bacteroides fragilis]
MSKLLSPRSNTEYHRVFLLIINNLKSSLCYSVLLRGERSFDTVPFIIHRSSSSFTRITIFAIIAVKPPVVMPDEKILRIASGA